MSQWYKWESIELFNVWHEAKMIELGLPKLSVDLNGNIIPDSVQTNAITIPIEVSITDFRALVEDENAEGLILSSNPMERNEINSL